jgi:hypothetical protein
MPRRQSAEKLGMRFFTSHVKDGAEVTGSNPRAAVEKHYAQALIANYVMGLFWGNYCAAQFLHYRMYAGLPDGLFFIPKIPIGVY